MTIATMDVQQAQAWLIVGGVIVTTITGIAGVIVSTVNSLRLGRTEAKVDAVKADVDGAASLARETLKITKERVAQLEDFITNKTGEDVPLETKQTAQRDEAPKTEHALPTEPKVAPIPPLPTTNIPSP